MAEYQPLYNPDAVGMKMEYWSSRANKIPFLDQVLFQLVQDAGNARGAQRWEKQHKVRLSDETTVGYSPQTPDAHCSFSWMEHLNNTYKIRMKGSPSSEKYTLFEITNGTSREVPASEIELRRQILSTLSESFNNSPFLIDSN